MNLITVVSKSGVRLNEGVIKEVAVKALKTILSELPEEARTYDMVFRTIDQTKEALEASGVKL